MKMIETELTPKFANVKSFYRKAHVLYDPEDGTFYLKSYSTIVGKIEEDDEGTLHYIQLWDGYSHTTSRHIKEFKLQFNAQ